MFASLKNKIREETGSDISKLTAKITSSTSQKIDSLRGKGGSTSSVNSLVSLDGAKDDSSADSSKLEEDFRKRVLKIETEFVKKLDDKEREWKEVVAERDKRLRVVELEREEAMKEVKALKGSLRNAEEFKLKLMEHQVDKDQIENIQSQELTKVKQLVLLQEQELAEKNGSSISMATRDLTSSDLRTMSNVINTRPQVSRAIVFTVAVNLKCGRFLGPAKNCVPYSFRYVYPTDLTGIVLIMIIVSEIRFF